jgi:hypothetical protein
MLQLLDLRMKIAECRLVLNLVGFTVTLWGKMGNFNGIRYSCCGVGRVGKILILQPAQNKRIT